MDAIYSAALARVDFLCNTFAADLSDRDLDATTRRNLRERRDYWHVIGSKIRQRMARKARRDK